ncbi:hypothetical protein ABZV14_11495 [Streptosporangium canum]|uniref:hypothetical protein n=1 Tax=Streptosporangium canum TaxID=324952 RepID=UPI0033BEB23B
MAVDQNLLDQVAGTVADLYREVEASLVTVIADELKKDLIAPTAEVKLGVRRSAQLLLASLQAARARVRAAQAALREHLKANPKLKRLPYRERIGAGIIPPAGGPKGGPVGDLQPPAAQRLL